jgi:hypothetical protein
MRTGAGVIPSNAALAAGSAPQAKCLRPWPLFFWTFFPLAGIYGLTRASTVTGEDSGELISAAWTLGVAHPPGYPLWVFMTHAFQELFHGLGPACAANFASGITTATAMGVLAVLAGRLTGSYAASLFAGYMTGLGHEFWNHATIAEVYPLTLLILSMSLLLFHRWLESPAPRPFFLLAFVYGCGLAHHPTFHLFLPVFGPAVLLGRPRLLKEPKSIGLGILGLLLPHLAYAQVWIAATSGPFVSWGVEPTLPSVLGHYLR